MTFLLVWGFLHEDKFVEFEDNIVLLVRNKINETRKNRRTSGKRRISFPTEYSTAKTERNKKPNWNTAA